MAGKTWWKRKGGVIDLTAEVSICPTCGGPGSIDCVDLVLQKSLHTCGRCASLWETASQHAPA